MNKLITVLAAGAMLTLNAPAFAQDATLAPAQVGGMAQAQTQTLSLMQRAQVKLKDAGLFRGEISGIRTIATERALRRYQRANNLRVTGTLTAETVQSMGI